MKDQERVETLEMYDESITQNYAYAGIASVLSGLSLVAAVVCKSYDIINKTADFESGAIMGAFFTVTFGLTAIVAFLTGKMFKKEKQKFISPRDKIQRATELQEEKGERTKAHNDYVNRITKK